MRRQPPQEERVPQKPQKQPTRCEDTHQGHGGHAASSYPEGQVKYVKHEDSQPKPLDHHTAAKPRPLTPRDPRKEEVAACRLTLSEALDPNMSRPLKQARADEVQHSHKRKIAQAGQPTVQSGEGCEREWPQELLACTTLGTPNCEPAGASSGQVLFLAHQLYREMLERTITWYMAQFAVLKVLYDEAEKLEKEQQAKIDMWRRK